MKLLKKAQVEKSTFKLNGKKVRNESWSQLSNQLALIIERQPAMTEEEIIKVISKVEGLDGMTVNEGLFVCRLMDEFDKALTVDKDKAKKILELLVS